MSHSDKRDFNETIDSDEEQTSKKRRIKPQSESSDLYLDTVSIFLQSSCPCYQSSCFIRSTQINRHMLDFDFEKGCSVSLSNLNAYACLVGGKYFQGKKIVRFTEIKILEYVHIHVHLRLLFISTFGPFFPCLFSWIHWLRPVLPIAVSFETNRLSISPWISSLVKMTSPRTLPMIEVSQ